MVHMSDHGTVLLEVGNWISLITAFLVLGVWAFYGLFFHWTKTRPGRAVYYLLTALVLAFVLSTGTLWFGYVWGPPEWFLREWFRIIVWLFGAFAVIKVAWGLVSNWRRAGTVLSLEARMRRARARLEGKPETKETPTQ